MKICIVGAGAIGGFLAAKLAMAGHEISVVARGDHLAAIAADGLKLIENNKEQLTHPACGDDPTAFGVQDYVILAVKAPSLRGVASRLDTMLGDDTTVVTAMNGIPWWFCHGIGGPLEGRQLISLDPDGTLAAAIPLDRLIGCVIHGACEVPAPGVIRHKAGGHFILGEPQGGSSGRCTRLAEAIGATGLECSVHPRIQDAIWHKLLGNLPMNPIAALTGATLEALANNARTRGLCAAMMEEAIAVGTKLGLTNETSVEARIELGASLGAFKVSMLQDMEKGRPMEIDAMIAVVVELAAIAACATPSIDAVLALITLRAEIAGLGAPK